MAEEPTHRKAARYVWALLLACIYKVLPLVCPKCGGEMRIIAFINDGPGIREILGHLGEPTSAPRIAPARGPPLWEVPVAGQAKREAPADFWLLDKEDVGPTGAFRDLTGVH